MGWDGTMKVENPMGIPPEESDENIVKLQPRVLAFQYYLKITHVANFGKIAVRCFVSDFQWFSFKNMQSSCGTP